MPPNGRVYITPNTAVTFFYIDQFRNPWRLASAMPKSRHQLTILRSSREGPPQLEPDTSELLQTVVQIPRRNYVPWGPVRKRICVSLRRANQRPGRTVTFSMLLCIDRYKCRLSNYKSKFRSEPPSNRREITLVVSCY